jgi:vacuolar protein sorting-associated protein 13A/C
VDSQTPRGARDPFHSSDNVVRLGFITWSRESSKYSGLDTELTLTLSTLHLYCHRPTVAALMAFGTDMADIGSLLALQKQASAAVGGQPVPGLLLAAQVSLAGAVQLAAPGCPWLGPGAHGHMPAN